MSVTAKVTFGTCVMISVGIVAYVHYRQQEDRQKMHEGVIRDIERQHMRKTQNIILLQKQKDLTKRLKEEEEGAEGHHQLQTTKTT